MTNYTRFVHEYIKKNPHIERCLRDDILNIRGLAGHIIKENKLKASTHAVISAIRRFEFSEKAQKTGFNEIMARTKISTKSHLTLLSVIRDFKLLSKILPTVFDELDPARGDLMRLVEGRKSFKLLIDMGKKIPIMTLIKVRNITDIRDNIAEVNLFFSGEQDMTGNMMANVLAELNLNNIIIYDIFGCFPEYVILIDEKQAGKAHDVLVSMFYSNEEARS